jgi:hypothetical protein
MAVLPPQRGLLHAGRMRNDPFAGWPAGGVRATFFDAFVEPVQIKHRQTLLFHV